MRDGQKGTAREALRRAAISRRAFCGLTASLIPAYAQAASQVCETQSPNVVIIVLDTVRAQNMSCYGYGLRTTPWLDALAEQAVSYTRARSTAAWTLPSHASIFTGLYPFEHKAWRCRAKPVLGYHRTFSRNLHPRHVTLAEALVSEGYATGAFVANTVYLSNRHNVMQGFQRHDVCRLPGAVLAERALSWVTGLRGSPFFLFLNFMDAHVPYNTAPRPGLFNEPVSQDKKLEERLYRLFERKDLDKAPEELIREVLRQYDTAIANADLAAGIVIEGLRRRELLDTSVLVVTSDHGEYFGEHSLMGHSKDVYEPAVHIPLLVRYPGQQTPQTVSEHVSIAHIPHFVLNAFPEPARERHAYLCAHRPGLHPVICENRYARSGEFNCRAWGDAFKRIRVALYDGSLKYIHSSDGDHELYDLDEDPGESDNLIERRRDVAERMSASLLEFRPASSDGGAYETPEEQAPLTDEELDEMKALGYLG